MAIIAPGMAYPKIVIRELFFKKLNLFHLGIYMINKAKNTVTRPVINAIPKLCNAIIKKEAFKTSLYVNVAQYNNWLKGIINPKSTGIQTIDVRINARFFETLIFGSRMELFDSVAYPLFPRCLRSQYNNRNTTISNIADK